MKHLHQKIRELQKTAPTIRYNAAQVDAQGKLVDREKLLDKRIVEGYGCIWGNVNMHRERFHKGAFTRSIRENGPKSGANYQIKFRDGHGQSLSLFQELKEDETGLYFRTVPLDDISIADDVLTQIKSGTLNNFSNGFTYVFNENSMKWNDKEEVIEIYEARLLEISVVDIPSDLETFALRGAEGNEDLFEETEDFIKQLPRSMQLQARKIIARHKSLTVEAPGGEGQDPPRTEKPGEIEQRSKINYKKLISKL